MYKPFRKRVHSYDAYFKSLAGLSACFSPLYSLSLSPRHLMQRINEYPFDARETLEPSSDARRSAMNALYTMEFLIWRQTKHTENYSANIDQQPIQYLPSPARSTRCLRVKGNSAADSRDIRRWNQSSIACIIHALLRTAFCSDESENEKLTVRY